MPSLIEFDPVVLEKKIFKCCLCCIHFHYFCIIPLLAYCIVLYLNRPESPFTYKCFVNVKSLQIDRQLVVRSSLKLSTQVSCKNQNSNKVKEGNVILSIMLSNEMMSIPELIIILQIVRNICACPLLCFSTVDLAQ